MKLLGAIAFIYTERQNDGRVVDKVEILQHIWNMDSDDYSTNEYFMRLYLTNKAIKQYKRIRIISENFEYISNE